MKIKKIKGRYCKLLKLKLIRTKTYTKKNQLINVKLEDIEKRLKKALKIIYAYHKQNKQILFIGNSLKISNKLKNITKNTKHIVIPESLWTPGMISNKNSILKKIKKRSKFDSYKFFKLMFQLNKKSDLIVIFNSDKNHNSITESYTLKIPTISFGNSLDIFSLKSNYKIPGNFKFDSKTIRDDFLCSMIISSLKQAKKTNKTKI